MRAAYSPFLTIPVGWRIVIVFYFFAYEWLFPVIAAIGSNDAQALLVPRLLLRLIYLALICWPLVFYRREFGFLHPLILPTLFITLKDLAKFPLALILPFDLPFFTFDVPSLSTANSISRLSTEDLAWARLWHEATLALALSSYYLGYFYLSLLRVPKVRFKQPHHLVPICLVTTMICVLTGVIFIQLFGGGLINHLIAMRTGRSALFEGMGQFLFVAEFAVVPVLVWFVYARRPFADPRWLFALVLSAFVGMLTTGSRSAFVYPLIVLMLLWWQKAGRVLIGPTLALAFAAVIVVGGFGMVRQDSGDTLDVSIFHPAELNTVVLSAQDEFKERSAEESSFATFAGARDTLLFGKTYVASLAFFIPRFAWPGKPRSADAYNMWINFSGYDLASFGEERAWGMPVGPVEEAFWNFHIPGVIVLFLILGSFHRWLSNWVLRNPSTPALLLVSVWISINFTGTSITLTGMLRDAALITALFYFLKIWRFNRVKKSNVRTEYVPPRR